MKRWTALVFSAIALSTLGVFIRLIDGRIPVETISFFRLVIGLLFIFAVIGFLDKGFHKISGKDLLHYFVIGVLLGINVLLYNTAFTLVPVANVALIGSLSIVFVGVFAHFLIGEKMNFKSSLVAVVALIGLAVMNPLQEGYALGNFLVLLSAVNWGFIAVLMRKENKDHSIGNVFWYIFFATLVTIPLPLVYG